MLPKSSTPWVGCTNVTDKQTTDVLASAVIAVPRSSNRDYILRALLWLKVLEAGTHWIQLFPPRISSSSLLLRVTCTISSQSSLLDSLDHLHWSLSSIHQFIPVSRSQTALFSVLHLTCGTSFLLLFVFPISLLHYHPALLHHQALILNGLLTFLMAFFTVIL